jgi:nucleoside-diphosphate-sugar epimerase
MSSLKNCRVLVTGGGGFLGSYLVRALAYEGAEVGSLVRSTRSNFAPFSLAGVRFLDCDITNPSATRRVVEDFGPEILYHFAAHPDGAESHEQASAAVNVNLNGTLNLLEAFSRAGGRMFVYGDSSKVYGNGPLPHREDNPIQPTSSYAVAKAAGWEMCRLYGRLHGFDVLSFRPTMIYGPGQAFNLISFVVERVLEGKSEIPLMGGSQTRDPLYVTDAIDAFLAAAREELGAGGRVINIGGGLEISVHQLAQEVVRMMDSRARIVIQARQARPTEIWRSYCDNREAEDILGWRPRTPLQEGLRSTIQFLTETKPGLVSVSS